MAVRPMVRREPPGHRTYPDSYQVTAVAVTHGRAVPALAYRFDTADGSVVFSGDTTVNDDLIALAQRADILVHQVADLGYLGRHGTDNAELGRMAALHTDVTQVGGVAERARVRELILSHYLPAEPYTITEADWAQRAGQGFSGRTTAGSDGLRRALSSRRPNAHGARKPRACRGGNHRQMS
jgi:ribonuclease BN (tRNA processing enzyme)